MLASLLFSLSLLAPLGPRAVVTADFDRDGKLDLAVASGQANTLAVYHGNGDGTFQAPTVYAACLSPYDLIVADLNGDGWPDLVMACPAANGIRVFINNGTAGGFTATNYPAGLQAMSLVASDLNSDGIPDLAVADMEGQRVTILYGTGGGKFQARQSVAVALPFQPTWIRQYDATHLVLTDWSGNVWLMDFHGNLSRSYLVGQQPTAVAVYGASLIVLCQGNGGSVTWLVPDNLGGFSIRQVLQVGGQPQSVTVADMNGDGIPDLVVTNGSSQTLSIYYGTGSGFLAPITVATGVLPQGSAAGDFNGDGLADLAVADYADAPASVWIYLGK